MNKLLFTFFLLIFSLCSAAQINVREVHCVVVGVSDGDTLTCLPKNRKRLKVRLAEIDAPEKAQPFGKRSRQLLRQLVYKRQVKLKITGYDHHHRIVATVYDVKNRNVNLIMVQRGMAWAYVPYVQDLAYIKAQQQAQEQHIGLWRDPAPISPEQWRKMKNAH